MTDAFGDAYAGSYDALYADKDYEAECDLLESIFARGPRPVCSVLDLGCGTGAHAVRLAQRGYDVVGVDISAAMLEGARRRADAAAQAVEFVEGDVRSVRLGRTFDAVVCMFAVLGYQTTDQDVVSALKTVRLHLEPDGPFIFDVWYGPAVEGIGPRTRTKIVSTADGEIERQATALLDASARICTVSYQLTERRVGSLPRVFTETHRMRYFFRVDLEGHLEKAGLSMTDLAPFPNTTDPLTDESWNVLAVAR